MRIRYLLVALGVLLVSGCVSEQEQREIDQDKCSNFGFRAGTDANAMCIMRQNSQREEASQRYMDRLHADEERERDRKSERKREKKQKRDRDDDIDTRPQFDNDGNPNFDTKGNYQGCHGLGCSVDNPDDD